MARFFNLTETLPLAAIKPGELIPFPMLDRQAGPRYRIRDITAAALGPGTWPAHTEKSPELYIVLAGTVIYQTWSGRTPGERFVVTAGQAILFETGDTHETEVPTGILSVAINLIETDLVQSGQ